MTTEAGEPGRYCIPNETSTKPRVRSLKLSPRLRPLLTTGSEDVVGVCREVRDARRLVVAADDHGRHCGDRRESRERGEEGDGEHWVTSRSER